MYVATMVDGIGWATSTEIEAASTLLNMNINVWFNQEFKYTLHNFQASCNSCNTIEILLSRNHFNPLKKVLTTEIPLTNSYNPPKQNKRKQNNACLSEVKNKNTKSKNMCLKRIQRIKTLTK